MRRCVTPSFIVKRLLFAVSLTLLAAACAHAPRPDGNLPPAPAQPAAPPQPAAPAQPPQGPSGESAEAAAPPTPKAAPSPITFALVGDVMLGSSFPDET